MHGCRARAGGRGALGAAATGALLNGNDGNLALRPGRVLGWEKKKKKKSAVGPEQCSIAGPENRLAEMNVLDTWIVREV